MHAYTAAHHESTYMSQTLANNPPLWQYPVMDNNKSNFQVKLNLSEKALKAISENLREASGDRRWVVGRSMTCTALAILMCGNDGHV